MQRYTVYFTFKGMECSLPFYVESPTNGDIQKLAETLVPAGTDLGTVWFMEGKPS